MPSVDKIYTPFIALSLFPFSKTINSEVLKVNSSLNKLFLYNKINIIKKNILILFFIYFSFILTRPMLEIIISKIKGSQLEKNIGSCFVAPKTLKK